jgi:hypothetical protein
MLSVGNKIPDKRGVITVKIIYVDIGAMTWRRLGCEVDPLANTLKTIIIIIIIIIINILNND